MRKPILCMDFDGVIHSYSSGWQGANIITDPPVDRAAEFISEAIEHFEVNIFSSRTHQEGGLQAMKNYVEVILKDYWIQQIGVPPNINKAVEILNQLVFPLNKPPAFISLDDRAINFDGVFPNCKELLDFKPWNKKGI